MMHGNACHKLQIPLPGRGYWTKKEFGKPVERVPLPPAKDLPVVQRLKFPSADQSPGAETAGAAAELPTDPEFLRIVHVESQELALDPGRPLHKLVKARGKTLRRVQPDEKGMLQPPYNEPCLEIRVSKQALDRALAFTNAVILCLEAEGFEVTVLQAKHSTGVQIFGHRVPFAIVEKLREKSRRAVMDYSWTRTIAIGSTLRAIRVWRPPDPGETTPYSRVSVTCASNTIEFEVIKTMPIGVSSNLRTLPHPTRTRLMTSRERQRGNCGFVWSAP